MSDAVSHLARLEAALTASGDVAYDWDLSAGEISWLAGAAESLGLLGDGGISPVQQFHARIHPEDLKLRLDAVASLRPGNASFAYEFRLRGANGQHHWYNDRGSAEFDAKGRAIRLFGSLRPIGQEKSDHDKIQYLANYDELTGHFNKTRLREALDQALYYCSRYKVEGALFVVGIDNINVVNQAFGYDVADAVIVALGHRLDQCLRSSDIIGRLNGDCFGVILGQCPEDELPAAAEKILGRPQHGSRYAGRPDPCDRIDRCGHHPGIGKNLDRCDDQGRNRAAQCQAFGTEQLVTLPLYR